MPFYPNLPEPYVTNPITEGVRGFGLGMEVQNQALKAQQSQLALEEARNRREALKQYGQTGDVQQLRTIDPRLEWQAQEAEAKKQKVFQESIKPGLQYAYSLLDGMDETNYAARRATVVKNFPALDAIVPPQYDPDKVQQFKDSYDKMMKIEKPPSFVYDPNSKQFLPAPEGGTVKVAPRDWKPTEPKWTLVDTETGPQWAQHGATLPPGTTGRVPTSRQEPDYNKKIADVLFRKRKAFSELEKTKATKLKAIDADPNEVETWYQEQKQGIQEDTDQALERLQAGSGGTSRTAGGGGKSAGMTQIGTSPDGRPVYQDANGNKFVGK